jgi:hypothetical protein
MESLGLWILGVTAGSFVAGVVVGRAFEPSCAAASSSPEEAAYVADLTARYGLSVEQQRRLQFVVQYQSAAEIAIVRSVQFSQLPQPQNGQMLAVRTATENRIRALLDDAQRARYDRDRLGPQPTDKPTTEKPTTGKPTTEKH